MDRESWKTAESYEQSSMKLRGPSEQEPTMFFVFEEENAIFLSVRIWLKKTGKVRESPDEEKVATLVDSYRIVLYRYMVKDLQEDFAWTRNRFSSLLCTVFSISSLYLPKKIRMYPSFVFLTPIQYTTYFWKHLILVWSRARLYNSEIENDERIKEQFIAFSCILPPSLSSGHRIPRILRNSLSVICF